MSETEQETPQPDETPDVPGPPDEQVEPDEDEENEPAAPDAPLEEPDTEPSSEAVMEEIGKKLDSLQKTVATRMSSILGEHALDFEECDLCSYWNVPGWRMKGILPEELQTQLFVLLNQRAPSDLKPDPHSTVCTTCGGEGFVKTPSKVAGQEQLPCVECEAMGWLPTDDVRRRGRLSLPNGPTTQSFGATPQEAAMAPMVVEEPPEVTALRKAGYVVVPPIAAN
jgi:hypothetical protein